ncbi:TonB family protein [Pseudomonas sp. LS44]|uniref:energy transducer TonB n=1 Tax=Pseudomonas sp. LS44 TaxID=1357074 RepID=UPI00215AED8C|nr:energy transducer TonB [Pseudomonas sp. LS44]UVE17036.1 TonB family protein [Pseudomonas sp. LS44]
MSRIPLYASLSLVLHAGLGWLLQGQWQAHGQSTAVSQPVAIQISLAPLDALPVAAAPRPAATAPAQAVAATPAQRPPVKPVLTKPVVAKPPSKVAIAKAAPQPERRQPKPAALTAATTVAAAPTTQLAAAASAPRARTVHVEEVFSSRPSFLEPPKQPGYPALARRRNQQGVVLIEVRLDARGDQRELKLLRSSGIDSLDRAALEAVASWRFRAESQNGQPVPSRVHIPIQFALTASR